MTAGGVNPLVAGLSCRCPRCGEGALFDGFVRVAPVCEGCGMDLRAADSGDGPVVFIVLIVGALVCFAALFTEVAFRPPIWLHLVLWLPLTLILALAFMRPFKGVMLAMQFHHRASEAIGPVTSQPERKPKPVWLGAVFVALGLALLIGLGVWQLQRLKWKEGLLAHIAALQHAQPVDLASVIDRPARDLDFVRVRLDCPTVETGPALRLYAVQDAQAGSRLITACRVAPGSNRSILVDRGFLPQGQSPSAGREVTGTIVGVLRIPPGRNFVTPQNQIQANRWYWRDIPAMTHALCADKPVPVTLMLESPAAAPPGPKPAALPTEIPNRHLEYAITWFGLAAALAGVYAALLLRKRPI